MKKLLLLLFLSPLLSWSQTTVNVTFQVDMSEYTGAYTTVNVNGTFNSWCGGCAVMTDANNDSIYELVVAVPSGTLIEWKFTVDGWTGQEMFAGGEPCTMTTGPNTNRFGTFSADAVLPVACWNSCSACGVFVPTPCTEPFFSQYIEGSGQNKALELFNPTASPIDLSNYTVYSIHNGGSSNNTFNPVGTIPAYGTFTFANSGADSLLAILADTLLVTPTPVSFNGDDAVLLVKGTDTIDIIGVPNVDPGSNWPVGTGSTANHTLIRQYGVDMGTTDWTLGATQWDVYPSDTFTGFGSHSNICSPSDVTFSVDMSQYTGTYTTVNLNGTFNNWCGGCATMLDPDGDMIYELTINDLPNGVIEFKYTVDGWTGQENLTPGMPCVLTTGAFTNRSFTVAGDTTLSPVCWESCAACVVSNPCIVSMLPYTEDFETGFPACWDTTQNAGSTGFEWGDATSLSSAFLAFPAHTNFMASNDDDCNCDMSNDLLRTPQFDLTAYTGQSLLLNFEYFNNQEYGSVGTVWYSMNGGAITFLDSMAETLTSGAWENMTIDVSAVAGSDSVVFIFKHDDQGFWADGVAIDDVTVDVAPDPCVISTLPYTEDFELGFPACWDTTQNAGSTGYQWGDATTLASSFWPVPAHTNFMASNDDACNCDMSNDLLRTPQFDLTAYTGQSLLLNFEYFNNQEYGSVGTVWYSMNGGAITFLDSMAETLTSGAWENMTVDVSATAGSDSVVFIFKHDDTGTWADGVAIDDVSLDVGALTSDVTFQVDMNASGATFGYVNVSGNFNNWCGDCAQMTDANNDGVWELTITDIPNGPIEFKYSLDNWASDESLAPGMSCVLTTSGFTNRYLDVQGDTIMPVVCYTSCSACPANPVDVNVTFQVDMDGYTGTYTDVNLNGTFNGWCGGCATMTDLDGDNVYDLTVLFSNITPGDTIEWKFTVDGWTDQESLTPGDPCVMTTDGFTNRVLFLTDADTTIDVVCWNSCAACPSIGLEEEGFEFNLYPNPANDQVTLSSNINEEQTIRIIDAQGRLVQLLTTAANQNEVTIDISGLTAGWYTVTVESDSFYNVKKLVIQE